MGVQEFRNPVMRLARFMFVLPAVLSCLLAALATSFSSSAAADRFETLLQFPGSDAQTCILGDADVPDFPAQLRLTLTESGSGGPIAELSACDGAQFVPIAGERFEVVEWFNAADGGWDESVVTLPRGYLRLGPSVRAQFLSRDTSGIVADETTATGPTGLLSIAGNPLGVPAFPEGPWRLAGAGMLGLVLLMMTRGNDRLKATALAALVTVAGGFGLIRSAPLGAGLSIAPDTVTTNDAGYEHEALPASLDLRRGRLKLVASGLQVEFAVNNREPSLLANQDKMLFIGNSLTAGNNLPLMLSRIALQAGKQLQTQSVLMGGAALEDHWRNGDAQRAIASGDFPLVSLQQGPSSLPESQVNLRTWALRFNTTIRANGGRPLLYMVWPDRSRLAFFDDVRDSYKNAALDTRGAFAPAGVTWQLGWAADPALPLYDSDQFHPSTLGTYAAALTLFCTIYRQSPEGLPPYVDYAGGNRTSFPPAQAAQLQKAAWQACRDEGLQGEP